MKKFLLTFIIIFLFPSISFAEQTIVQTWNESPKSEKEALITGYVYGRIDNDSTGYNIICNEYKSENKDLCIRIALEFFPEETISMTISEIDISVFDYINAVFFKRKISKDQFL